MQQGIEICSSKINCDNFSTIFITNRSKVIYIQAVYIIFKRSRADCIVINLSNNYYTWNLKIIIF